jgi:transcriptional regulator with XRE-family HTH domain
MSKFDDMERVYMPGIELVREDFKTALEFRRQTKRYTRKKLSEESGVSFRMIQYYEQGTNDINKAEALTVYKLAQALECKVEDLLEIE